jgi:Alkylmercury lyase
VSRQTPVRCRPWPARAGRLTGPARQAHQAVLAAFTATGQPPTAAEIEHLIQSGGGDPGRVRAELTEADLLAFTPDGGIRAAYPFSPAPTPIRVRWDGGPEVHAMCAIDALGMSAMLGRPVAITAAEPDTGRPITVTVSARPVPVGAADRGRFRRRRWRPVLPVGGPLLQVHQLLHHRAGSERVGTPPPRGHSHGLAPGHGAPHGHRHFRLPAPASDGDAETGR